MVITACQLPPAAFDLRNNFSTPLEMAPESGLIFATLENQHISIILARKGAGSGDFQYKVENCLLPLILRMRVPCQFQIIGEACIRRHSDGRWYTAERPLWIEDETEEARQMTMVQRDLGGIMTGF
ncbi:hypothetical protein F5Y19DRAFT_425990 [Xylariaceae sp. FL1651]|nr:hypothetical protein F5Y19DRAFT_425990 [Xylariaceae sp. FL1651]